MLQKMTSYIYCMCEICTCIPSIVSSQVSPEILSRAVFWSIVMKDQRHFTFFVHSFNHIKGFWTKIEQCCTTLPLYRETPDPWLWCLQTQKMHCAIALCHMKNNITVAEVSKTVHIFYGNRHIKCIYHEHNKNKVRYTCTCIVLVHTFNLHAGPTGCWTWLGWPMVSSQHA